MNLIIVVGCASRASELPPPVPAPALGSEAEAKAEVIGGRPALLIMPLKSEAGLEAPARALDELILTAVHDIKRYRVLGPADLNAVLGVEQLKDAMGCDEVSCAAEIGGALGAPFLVAGQLGKLGDQAVLSLRLMDTREPSVLARSSARGDTDGDALATMMSTTVGELFQVKIATPARTPSTASPGGPDYSEFTAVTTALGKRMMQNEYTELLADLDRYEKKEIKTPPNYSLPELLAFYRVTACFMLKRGPCVRTVGALYLKRWPTGMYQMQIQSYIDQLDDMALNRDAKADELKAKLQEISERQHGGTYTLEMAEELRGAAYMSAQRYDDAARHYAKLVDHYTHDAEKMLQIVQILAVAYEQAGRFDDCRALLLRAQKLYPKAFRLQGLYHHLNRLPK